MTPTPYSDLNMLLAELCTHVKSILADNLVGIYLQGSFAVGDFDRDSDVDFIVMVKDALATHTVKMLEQMHARLWQVDNPWAKHLEGSYFTKAVLADIGQVGTDVWFLDHGSRVIVQSNHCNTLVVRWVLYQYGIALVGPPIVSLLDPIDENDLRREIFQTVVEWGQEILAEQSRYNNRFYQGFILLSYCRMWHDLHCGCISSKRTGTEWAKQRLDTSWHDLIDKSWLTRVNPATTSRQPADSDDFRRTMEFMTLIMDLSRQYMEAINLI